MVDYHKILVATLGKILPTHYEMFLHSGLETPCISYMELNNSVEESGDTLTYSNITYQVKVWGKDIATVQKYAVEVDKALKPLGFKRTNSNELATDTMIQKILTFEAKALEEYN